MWMALGVAWALQRLPRLPFCRKRLGVLVSVCVCVFYSLYLSTYLSNALQCAGVCACRLRPCQAFLDS